MQNTYAINPALLYIATYVSTIADACLDPMFPDLSGGQFFDSDNYNVILRGNDGRVTSC